MNKKPLSTYERLMQDPEFRDEYEKEYQELALSESLLARVEEDGKSVRELSKEVDLSGNTVQNIRSGERR